MCQWDEDDKASDVLVGIIIALTLLCLGFAAVIYGSLKFLAR